MANVTNRLPNDQYFWFRRLAHIYQLESAAPTINIVYDEFYSLELFMMDEMIFPLEMT